MPENKSPRNKTLYFDDISDEEKLILDAKIIKYNSYNIDNFLVDGLVDPYVFCNKTVQADCMKLIPKLKAESVDLLILDPPYNIDKQFSPDSEFKRKSTGQYKEYIRNILLEAHRILKSSGNIYLCNDWRGSCLQEVLEEFFIVRNRITWRREKGRSSSRNFKNNSEDIWFCTKSNDYTFNAEAVKVKKEIIAPYKKDGEPKGWTESEDGNYRMTGLSNFWADTIIPFWSMPENTEMNCQKPIEVIERLILASSNIGDIVLDPFGGSGTTSVVAKKIGRNYVTIERSARLTIIIEKRLSLVESYDVLTKKYNLNHRQIYRIIFRKLKQ